MASRSLPERLDMVVGKAPTPARLAWPSREEAVAAAAAAAAGMTSVELAYGEPVGLELATGPVMLE